MPSMISLRNFRLATTGGHVIKFEAKKPTYVPAAAVSEAMAAGCVPENEADTPFLDDLSRTRVEFVGEIRRSMLYLAVKTLAEKNDSNDFDAGGNPKVAPIKELLGFEVSKKDLLAVFQDYMNVLANGGEFPLHEAAPNILRVLEAESQAELVELADEFGVDKEKAAGLVAKDLRKLLLVKFTGIAAD